MDFKNEFGHIDDEQLTLMNGYAKVNIQLSQIKSINVKRKRSYVLAILGFLFGLTSLIMCIYGVVNGYLLVAIPFVLLSIFGLAIGLASWLGRHYIFIDVEGKIVKPIRVKMNQIPEAEKFYKAIREVVYHEKDDLLNELQE